ncbi:MAG: iron complex transport system ATP-binding protein [Planctomycetota bacterium]|jgi:iron complex transport system ATP-binding protein
MVAHLVSNNLSVGYGEKPVVSGLSLEIEAGELVAIIGQNGVGKSTVVKGLAGLIQPMAGSIEIMGEDLVSLKVSHRAKKIAVLPQTLRFLRGITVAEFVTQGRYIHRPSWQRISSDDEAAIEDSLQINELTELRDRPMDQLSGGERQRCVLARALAQEADILLVDEPTAALDARHQLWAFRRLEEVAKQGKAVVVVTHDLNLASQFADRVVYLNDGQVAAVGTPQEVLRPEKLDALLGNHYLAGTSYSGAKNEERPWFIPWWHGEGHEPKGPRHEDQGPGA